MPTPANSRRDFLPKAAAATAFPALRRAYKTPKPNAIFLHSHDSRRYLVKDVFRSMKSLLDTRPICHKSDATIRGQVFCSFPALLMVRNWKSAWRKEWKLEWAEVIGDLDHIIEMEVAISGKGYV